MKGLRIDQSLKRSPEIARYLILYEKCRMTQVIQVEGSRGSGKSAQRTLRTTMLPTGYGVMPYAGGVFDQPYRMMEFFDIFFITERNEAFRNMSS